MDPAGNFRNYRNHAETLAPPMTPYIGTEPSSLSADLCSPLTGLRVRTRSFGAA
jgi:hypothetical protein